VAENNPPDEGEVHRYRLVTPPDGAPSEESELREAPAPHSQDGLVIGKTFTVRDPPPIGTSLRPGKRSAEAGKFFFKCTHCGKCCSDPATFINLTYHDILGLAKYMNFGLDQMLEVLGFYLFEGEMTPEQMRKMVFPPVHTEEGMAFVGLRRRDDGRCIYLNDENTCDIYPARPMVCRSFPFHFHLGTPRPEGQFEIRMSYAAKAEEYCEGIGPGAPKVDTPRWIQVGAATIKNILEDIKLVQEWNSAVEQERIRGTARNYLATIFQLENPANHPKKKQSVAGARRAALAQKLSQKKSSGGDR
jgi:Fe-S-cluster containining protein